MRIISLLPSITEILCELGLEHQLVGRSHECSQSAYIRSLPAITSPEIKQTGDSTQIDSDVRRLIENGLSVYKIDSEALQRLNPDLILTQDHCEVCAASLKDVEEAVQRFCSEKTRVVSLSPVNLKGIMNSVLTIGKATNKRKAANHLLNDLNARFEIIRRTINGTAREEIVTIEWLDPLMTGGNWIPELIDLAGAEPCLAVPGRHSPVIEWEKILEANPDKLFIMPCGFTIDQTEKEMHLLTERAGWSDLKAVKSKNVFILDGDRFFNRPGPGVYDSARIIAEICHPSLFNPLYKHDGWVRWQTS